MTVHQDAARRRAGRPLWALLVTALAAAALVLWGYRTAPDSYRTETVSALAAVGVLLCVAVTAASHFRRQARGARRRLAAEAGDAANASAAAAADAVRFADETVPAVLARLGKGASSDTAITGIRMPDNPAYQRLLKAVADEASRSENRRAAAMAACANAAGRMQAMATGMLADLREMENRHADATVLADLLHLDHRTAQAGRVADSIAVLSGARSGRRWAKPIAMESILRGAMGRIAGYQRVRLRSVASIAVAGHAAEGVMHVIAELLDNACNFSPPTTEVHVYVSEVPAGAAVTIEDAGLVMSDTALRRAEQAVTGAPGDLSTLTGTRLGLAVVGHLAYKHGLTVSFRPSAVGGTGVVLMIPQELVTRIEEKEPEPEAAPVLGPAVTAVRDAAVPDGQDERHAAAADTEHTGRGEGAAAEQPADFALASLPQRRRGRTLAAAHPDGLPGDKERRPRPEPEDGQLDRTGSAERFGAFHRAVTGQEQPADAAPADAPPAPETAGGSAPPASAPPTHATATPPSEDDS